MLSKACNGQKDKNVVLQNTVNSFYNPNSLITE